MCELADDDACVSQAQAERHHRDNQELIRRQAELDRADRQRQHEAEIEQMRATARAAGLDPDKGTGWYCFWGDIRERSLSECRRTWDECADRLLMREKAGLVAKERKCVEQAQAACFDVTRTMKEGPRALCYGEVAMCDDARAGIDPEGFISPPSECAIRD